MNEHDLIVLTRDMPEHGLEKGDVGTIVHVYPGARAFEVEFALGEDGTVGVFTLEPSDLRPRREQEILHTRDRL